MLLMFLSVLCYELFHVMLQIGIFLHAEIFVCGVILTVSTTKCAICDHPLQELTGFVN